MKCPTLTVALMAVILVAGCSSAPKPPPGTEPVPKHAARVQVLMYDSTPRPKTAHLEIFDMKPPEKPFKVLALLTCDGKPSEEVVMLEAIFYRAKQIGADAVMNADTAITEGGGLALAGSGAGFGVWHGGRRIYRARAIVFEVQ